MPVFEQLFLAAYAGADGVRPNGLALDRLIFPARKRIEHQTEQAGCEVYFPSLSSRTITYKGMLTTEQLPAFYPDLTDVRMESAIAIVHSRFSTNTFPAWPLAHPFRYIAHNGEINTVRGNRNWMRAREALLKTDLIAGDLSRIYPICSDGASDSASFDEVLELLHLSGRSLPHAMMMMIPEAWENNPIAGRAGPRLPRVPRLPDRAVGRPGVRDVHRRPDARRGAGPQRPAARPLVA